MDGVSIKVLMIVTGFLHTPDGLEKIWEFEDMVKPHICMLMSTMAGGGKHGAIIVKCNTIKE